jgi:hypothetical protein
MRCTCDSAVRSLMWAGAICRLVSPCVREKRDQLTGARSLGRRAQHGYADPMQTTSRSTLATRTAAVRCWHVAALMLVALTMGLEFAHALELVPKRTYPTELYIHLQNTLYVGFGTVGLLTYVGAIGATAALVWLVRRRRHLVTLTVSALVLQVIALAGLLTLIVPVNARLRALAPGELPPDFTVLRDQWEYTHAAGFVLFTVAFVLLLTALLRDVDRDTPRHS